MKASDTAGIETPLVKVPYERLRRAVRERKNVVEEVNNLVTGIADYEPDTEGSKEEHIGKIDSIVDTLQTLKRKLDETGVRESEEAARCRARVEHLQTLANAGPEGQALWRKLQLDRLIVDHLLRNGYYNAAEKLAESSRIKDLVDLDIFMEARQIVDTLQQHKCTAALEWCAENNKALRKIKSKLEFKLRQAEFLELVKADRKLEAVSYSQKYLAPWASTHMKEFQETMATLVVPKHFTMYKHLFDDSRWEELIDLFKADSYRLNSLTLESLLGIHLQAGLVALKTPSSFHEECSYQDPLHLPVFRQLAEGLPFAKHIHSKLVCYITKELMNEDNPPMVLPNGCVYSYKALAEQARLTNKVTCPRTGFVCDFSELSKAFIS